jgi:hypothetical protein
LKQTYANFQKVDRLQIDKQFATFTDEFIEMFDEDENDTPVEAEGSNLPNKVHLDDNDE